MIVGSGAQILGPFTVGAGARVGANAVVVNAVPPAVTVVGIPAKIVKRAEPTLEPADFEAYGVVAGMTDPVARSLAAMQEELEALRTRVAELEDDAATVDSGKNQGCSAA